MRLKAIPFAIMVMDHLNRNSLMKTLNILLGLEILCLNHYHKWLQMLVRLPTLLLVIVDHLLQDLFQESNVSVLFSREAILFIILLPISIHEIKIRFHDLISFLQRKKIGGKTIVPKLTVIAMLTVAEDNPDLLQLLRPIQLWQHWHCLQKSVRMPNIILK